MGVLNTVQLLDIIHFNLVCWLGGDRVMVLRRKRGVLKKNLFDQNFPVEISF